MDTVQSEIPKCLEGKKEIAICTTAKCHYDNLKIWLTLELTVFRFATGKKSSLHYYVLKYKKPS